eukprot:74594-Hanusia_phi.AAC.1
MTRTVSATTEEQKETASQAGSGDRTQTHTPGAARIIGHDRILPYVTESEGPARRARPDRRSQMLPDVALTPGRGPPRTVTTGRARPTESEPTAFTVKRRRAPRAQCPDPVVIGFPEVPNRRLPGNLKSWNFGPYSGTSKFRVGPEHGGSTVPAARRPTARPGRAAAVPFRAPGPGTVLFK